MSKQPIVIIDFNVVVVVVVVIWLFNILISPFQKQLNNTIFTLNCQFLCYNKK